MKVSIIIPALNEEEGIEKTIKCIPREALENMGFDVQILVVDNGSTDRTAELAQKAGADVISESKRGYGYAYKAGFSHANGDIFATADADMTYPVEDIPRLIKQLNEENLDFITTNRYEYIENGAMTPLHKFGNSILNLSTRLLFQTNLKDSQSGMWIFRSNLLDQTIIRSNSMALSEELKIEMCYFLNCKWKEIPIKYRVRLGKVKLNTWKDGFSNLLYLFRKRLRR